jgi:hypothetical protein
MKYKESGEWEKTGFDFPGVIIVCQSEGMLAKAQRRVRYLTRNDLGNVTFILIDVLSLQTIQSTSVKEWFNATSRTLEVL